MTDFNIPNLRLFVGALREVVETVPEASSVNMNSIRQHSCGRPGCHAGLAMLALESQGYRSRDRQFAIEVLGFALESNPAEVKP